jgi:hypothetical protein
MAVPKSVAGPRYLPSTIGIRKDWGRVTEHYPVVPCKFADSTDIGSLAGHNGLRHLAVGQDMATDRMRTNQRLQLKAVVP